jgi:hypothetical protein
LASLGWRWPTWRSPSLQCTRKNPTMRFKHSNVLANRQHGSFRMHRSLNLVDLFLRSTRTRRQRNPSAQLLGGLVSGKRIKLWYRPTRHSSVWRDEYKRGSNRGSTIVSTVLTHCRQYCRLLQQRLTKPESRQRAAADNAARKSHGSTRFWRRSALQIQATANGLLTSSDCRQQLAAKKRGRKPPPFLELLPIRGWWPSSCCCRRR